MIIKSKKQSIKGITLVALVVTIIVLLILAGVAINLSIGEDGIFKKAQESSELYQNSSLNEQIEMDKISNYISDYLNKNDDNQDGDEDAKLSQVEEAINNGTVFQKNTVIADEYENNIKIPAGFKLAKDSGKTALEGIVIEDVEAGDSISKGNQYVWIPINEVKTSENGDITVINLGRYDFENNPSGEIKQSANNYTEKITINNEFQEWINNDYENTVAKDLTDFIEKASTSNGFYIGRYEVGDADATSKRDFGGGNISNTDASPVVKKDKWPYTYVYQPDAATLAQNMYSSNNFQSDLMNSYAYDTALIFIQTFSNDKDYSNQSRICQGLTTTGNSCDENNNYDVRCNIYDMSGNTREWTTETALDEENPCTNRRWRK